ncbi:MAG: DHH family phosphoesterase [Planctomycetota bacterium]
MTNSDFQKAVDLVNKADNILLTTHTRPDGDACGCLAAMHDALTALGKNARIIFLSPIPEWYEFLFPEIPPILGRTLQLEQLLEGHLGQFDLTIILDTNSNSQLPKFEQYLKQGGQPVLVIDHHVTKDGLGDVELVDSTAAATALIVLDFIKFADWPITENIARALFLALATDTGWFQFSNTDARVFRCSADLIDAGADPIQIYHNLYQNYSPARFRLMAAMLNTLELHFDDRYATQCLTVSDFEQTGAAYSDTENLIDLCRRISTVEVAALFVESKDGRIRCSLRSRGAVDVSKIAQKFDGGGHKMAAGAFIPGPLKNAKKLIHAQLQKQLKNSP